MEISDKQKQNIERLVSDIDEGLISAIIYCQMQFKCSFRDAKDIVENVTSENWRANHEQDRPINSP